MKQKPYHVHEGRIFLRVTEVLSWFRDPELDTIDPAKLKELANIGDASHKWIEDDLNGKTPRLPKTHRFEVDSCVKAYTNWKMSRKPKPIATEYSIYSDVYGLSGTVDLLEEDCLTDWKTTSKITRKHMLQVNGYVGILMTMPEAKAMPDKSRVVRFDRTLAIWEEAVKEFNINDMNLLVGMARCYRAMFAPEIKQWEDEEGCLLIQSLS